MSPGPLYLSTNLAKLIVSLKGKSQEDLQK